MLESWKQVYDLILNKPDVRHVEIQEESHESAKLQTGEMTIYVTMCLFYLIDPRIGCNVESK